MQKICKLLFVQVLSLQNIEFVSPFQEIAIENFEQDTLCPLSPLGVKGLLLLSLSLTTQTKCKR